MSGPSVFRFQSLEDFRCIQDKCENTCCGDWRIPLPEKTQQKWANNYPAIHEIIGSDRTEWMPQNDAGQCTFFDGGKCGVHSQYGVEALAPECDKYPRRSLSVNDFEIQYAYPSCPEVARKVFLADDPFKIIKKESDDSRPEEPVSSDRVDDETVGEIYQRFIDHFLRDDHPAEILLEQFLYCVQTLDPLPMREWLGVLDANTGLLNPQASSDEERFPLGFSDAGNAIREQIDIYCSFLKDRDAVLKNGVDNHYVTLDWKQHPSIHGSELTERAANLDSWLKKHLAISFASIGLPFRSQTEVGKAAGITPLLWAKRIAYDFTIVRFCLQCLVDDERYADLRDDVVIDYIHRIYRVVFHAGSKPSESRFLAKDISDVITQVLCVK